MARFADHEVIVAFRNDGVPNGVKRKDMIAESDKKVILVFPIYTHIFSGPLSDWKHSFKTRHGRSAQKEVPIRGRTKVETCQKILYQVLYYVFYFKYARMSDIGGRYFQIFGVHTPLGSIGNAVA